MAEIIACNFQGKQGEIQFILCVRRITYLFREYAVYDSTLFIYTMNNELNTSFQTSPDLFRSNGDTAIRSNGPVMTVARRLRF